jgi:hypothetical protein
VTLTQQLRDAQSPVTRWFRQHLNDPALRRLVQRRNDALSAHPTLRVPGSTAQVVGTAIDYGVRARFGPLDRTCTAMQGARLCAARFGWPAAPALVAAVLEATDHASDVADLATWCIVLAWFERVYRDGELPPQLRRWVRHPPAAALLAAIQAAVPQADREDTALLLHAAAGIWNAPPQPIIQNPTFSGSGLVGGADADWITGDTLWECKCSWQARPASRQHILQLLSYALLDTYDSYRIQHLGWYYVRQAYREIIPLDSLCTDLLGTADLAALRQAFAQHVGGMLPPDPATVALGQRALPLLVEILASTGQWVLQEHRPEHAVLSNRSTGQTLALATGMVSGIATLDTLGATFAIPAGWLIHGDLHVGDRWMRWIVLPGDGARWIPVPQGSRRVGDRLIIPSRPLDLANPRDQRHLVTIINHWLQPPP